MYLYHLSPIKNLRELKPGFGIMPDGETRESYYGVYLTSPEFISAWRTALQKIRGKELQLYKVEVSHPIPPWFFDRASGVPWCLTSCKPSPEIIYELETPLQCKECENPLVVQRMPEYR